MHINAIKATLLNLILYPQQTKAVRPYVVCAVLRDVTFDQARYESFIALQDKLHKNICRERTLVAIGTHDLDTVQAPFTYEALAPTKIQFQPLSETKEFDAKELFPYYRQKANCKLVPYLPIIESSPVYPGIATIRANTHTHTHTPSQQSVSPLGAALCAPFGRKTCQSDARRCGIQALRTLREWVWPQFANTFFFLYFRGAGSHNQ